MHASFLASYPDWTAFTITILLSLLLGLGVRESTKFNNAFTLLNLGVVLFVTVVGLTQADFTNWALTVNNVTSGKKANDIISSGSTNKDMGASSLLASQACLSVTTCVLGRIIK